MMNERGFAVDHTTVSDCVKTQFLEKPLSQNQQLTGTKSPKIGVFTQSGLEMGPEIRARDQ
jgi:hypothetical protein